MVSLHDQSHGGDAGSELTCRGVVQTHHAVGCWSADAVDLYVAAKDGSVRIVDFNPPGGTTSPLLFSWEELAYPSLQARQPAVAALPAGRAPPSKWCLQLNGVAELLQSLCDQAM